MNAGVWMAGAGLPQRLQGEGLQPGKALSGELEPACRPVGAPEANVDLARLWWVDPRNVWPPIGWKDHLFRFAVAYDGSLLCAPAGWLHKPDTQRYRQMQNLQLTFTPSFDGNLPPLPKTYTKLFKADGGIGLQGWHEDKEAPVLWTDWPCQEGVVMRQEVFAHLRRGKAVETGVEPLYAWLRLSIPFVHPVNPPRDFTFGIQLSQVYYDVGGDLKDSVFLAANPPKAPFSTPLQSTSLPAIEGKNAGLRVLQNGMIRMLVLPGGDGEASLQESTSTKGTYDLRVKLPARAGAHADLLVPMLPESVETLQAEADLGFGGALDEAELFWTEKPLTAARISVPEKYIEHALKRNVQFAEVIAEHNPETGDYSFLSGVYGYDALWTTPTSMVSHMFLDLLGYHDVVERHIEIYKKYQGTIKPPGPSYEMDPGYFSTPKTLTAIDWLSDHGAVLETISIHALITGKQSFLEEWLDTLLKGCDFVKRSCAKKNTGGVEGIMPPAVATDTTVPLQAIWSEAWTYKGLSTAVSLLKAIKHHRAAEFEAVADSFKQSFESSFSQRIPLEPSWTDPTGRKQQILPTNLIPPPEHHAFDDAFLLDTGPLVLPWAGLFDAASPAMISFEEFFRVGPNNALRGPETGPITRAVLRHEISSCEVCYSWNIINSWRRGDRTLFLDGLYSLFLGGISPQTYINCEHRNAMYGTLFVAPTMTWALRQSVIDDKLTPGELHLLRLCPLAWIRSDEPSAFENMPTFFGVVNLRFGLSADSRTLQVTFAGKWRKKPSKTVLYCPPLQGVAHISVNGKVYPRRETILID
jgi:hypothetical protein